MPQPPAHRSPISRPAPRRARRAALVLALGAAPGLAALAGIAAADDRPALPAAVVAPAPLGPGEPSLPPASLLDALPEGIALRAEVAAQDPGDPFAEIDACVAAEMARTNTPGASIAVARDGEVVYARGYGVKREGQPGDVDAGTLFRIGSTTKMMTAAAVMQQVEAGAVGLDAPLATYVPGWDVAGAWDAPGVTGADVTPRHLLAHTSAYPDRIFLDTGIDGPKGPSALEDWARTGLGVTLHAPPGTFWNYSNPGFALAGLVAQNASGTPYADYLRDEVWAPAGMTATFLLPADAMAYGNVTHGHRTVDPTTGAEIVYAPDDYDNWAAAPAGYAFSRPTDLVRWADLLMRGGGDVLSSSSVAEMTAAQTSLGLGPGRDYGLGIFRTEILGRVIYDHGGNIPGWSSQLYWSPDDRVAISVLANTITSLTGSASCALLAMLDVEPTPGEDLTTDPSTWGRYLGEYNGLQVDGTELPVTVSRGVTGTLVATFPGLEIAPGVPYTSTMRQAVLDTFTIDLNADGVNESVVTFFEDPDRPGHARWLRNRAFVGTWQAPDEPTALPTTPPLTPTPTPTHVAPTPTPSPLPTDEPPPDGDPVEACDDLARAGVPAAAVAAALADPSRIAGHGQLCFPGQPPSPFNVRRRFLSLAVPGKPFHPVYNGLVLRCGCR